MNVQDQTVADESFDKSMEVYEYLIDTLSIKPEEARQVLPNACTVNFMWTINARSLVEFLNKRMCKRNVEEMRVFADKLYTLCMEWFPELFQHVGPQCKMLGRCRQGRMRAEECKTKR
jgi:thymidylate synthase (FAD)